MLDLNYWKNSPFVAELVESWVTSEEESVEFFEFDESDELSEELL